MDPISLSVAAASVFVAAFSACGLHRVPEGHTAVYYRGGALLDRMSGPGFHIKAPLIESVSYVQTTVQTDSVQNIT